MQKEDFKQLLSLATEQAKSFALRFIANNLPPDNLYTIEFNCSCDDPSVSNFDTYPEDNGKIIESANISNVVKTLFRNGKIPVWIDIFVSEVRNGKTLLKLICAGRYSNDINELYYHQRGLGPFGVKSPNLPVGYKEGNRFFLAKK